MAIRRKLLNATAFAKLCGVSPGTVTAWLDGGMPADRTGKMGSTVRIDPHLAVPWIVAGRDNKPGSERERLTKAQSIKVELENARRKGELVLVSHVEALFHGMAADIT